MGVIESCPHCGNMYGATFLFLDDCIGSPLFICAKCKQPFNSHRVEWAQMGFFRRLWVLIDSLLMATMFGFAAGYITKTVAFRFQWIENDHTHAVYPTERYAWTGAAVFAGLVFLVQLLKVYWSIRRTRGRSDPHLKARFFSLHTNLFFLFFVLVVLYAAVGHRLWEFLRPEYWQIRW
jgi:hypothetical protein